MRTVVPSLLPWLLLLPLCWSSDSLNPLQCGTGVKPLSEDIVNEIDPNKQCMTKFDDEKDEVPPGTFPFLMKIQDKCGEENKKDRWMTNKDLWECILHTTFNRNCANIKRKKDGTVTYQDPLDNVCKHYHREILRHLETAKEQGDQSAIDEYSQINKEFETMNCTKFSIDCKEKFELSKMCNPENKAIDNVSLECPTSTDNDVIGSYSKEVEKKCSTALSTSKQLEIFGCSLSTVFKKCTNPQKVMDFQCRLGMGPSDCEKFSEDCMNKIQQQPTLTSIPETSTPTSTSTTITTSTTETSTEVSTEGTTTSVPSSKRPKSLTLPTRQLPRGMLRDYNDQDFKNDDYKPQDDYNGEDDNDDDETPTRASASIPYRAIFAFVSFLL